MPQKTLDDALRNQLLAALPDSEREKILPALEYVDLKTAKFFGKPRKNRITSTFQQPPLFVSFMILRLVFQLKSGLPGDKAF